MSIKLIGLDLDRTTLNNRGHLSEKTKITLEEAINKGIHVIIATGRSYFSMPKDIYEIKGLKYTANSNGAEIRELHSGEIIYSNCIPAEEIPKIHDYLREKHNMIEVFVEGRAYIEKSDYEDVREYKKRVRSRDYVVKTRKPIEDIYTFMLVNREKIENINIFFDTDEDKMETKEKLLNKFHDVTITSSLPDNLEIGGKTTSKATALRYLAEKFNIHKDEIMCCGDSPNDISMLKMAGTAVAVENASDEVKSIANYTTASNDEDGVAMAVEKFCL